MCNYTATRSTQWPTQGRAEGAVLWIETTLPPNLLFVVYLINEKLFYDFVVVSCIGHTLITRYYLPNEFETTLERKNAPYRRRQKFDSQIAL